MWILKYRQSCTKTGWGQYTKFVHAYIHFTLWWRGLGLLKLLWPTKMNHYNILHFVPLISGFLLFQVFAVCLYYITSVSSSLVTLYVEAVLMFWHTLQSPSSGRMRQVEEVGWYIPATSKGGAVRRMFEKKGMQSDFLSLYPSSWLPFYGNTPSPHHQRCHQNNQHQHNCNSEYNLSKVLVHLYSITTS